jgi:cyclase
VGNIRLIARLDIKNENLIKGINLEGVRVVGPASEYALEYYLQGADELIFHDAVASLYERNHLHDILESSVKNIFIPITAGGGIRSIENASRLLRSGADKISINTAAVKRPELISELSETFGNQAIVLSVEAKKINRSKWEVYIDNGREKTGLDVLDWIHKGVQLGAGEILLTSVDQEGTRQGFDIELTKKASQLVNVPVITSGGMGTLEDFKEVVTSGSADAVAIASMLHYKDTTFKKIREFSTKNSIKVRNYE